MKAAFAALALLAAGQSSEGPPEGAISFSFIPPKGVEAGETSFRIEPDGKLTMKSDVRSPGGQADPTTGIVTRNVNAGGYRRIAALMAPLRRWQNEAPCPKPKAGPDPVSRAIASLDMTVSGTVRWEVDGKEVRLPITCHDGPARDDIELVRAAIDQVRTWANEGEEAAFDGAANAAEVTIPEGEK